MLSYENSSGRVEKVVTVLFLMGALMMASFMTWQLGKSIDGSTIAMMTIIVFGAVAITSPVAAIGMVFIFLAILGDVRRIFPSKGAGSSAGDLFLLVGPVTAIVLCAKLLFAGRFEVKDRLSVWIVWLMIIMTVQILNLTYMPLQANVAGGIFLIVPILWFWIGKMYGTEEVLEKMLLRIVFPVAIAACLFGIYQSLFDFPGYQLEWIQQTAAKGTLSAINVGRRARPFAFCVSPSEYAHLITFAIVIAIAGLFRKRLRYLILFLPAALVALVVQGGRGPLVFTLFAAAMMWALQQRNNRAAVARMVAALFVIGALMLLGLSTASEAQLDENIAPLVERQAQGLMNPLDTQKSTATDHVYMFLYGIGSSAFTPWGRGLGFTTLAGTKYSTEGGGTEIDVSDLFVSLGPVGGIIYVVIIILVFYRSIGLMRQTRSISSIAILGVLVTELTQWLNGAQYSIATICWFCIGSLTTQYEKAQSDLSLPPKLPRLN